MKRLRKWRVDRYIRRMLKAEYEAVLARDLYGEGFLPRLEGITSLINEQLSEGMTAHREELR